MAKGQKTSEMETKDSAENNLLETDTPQLKTIRYEEIAERAYALYLERGREDGRDVEDWLQAERELLKASHEDNKGSTRKASAA
jgi:hypothetical protein